MSRPRDSGYYQRVYKLPERITAEILAEDVKPAEQRKKLWESGSRVARTGCGIATSLGKTWRGTFVRPEVDSEIIALTYQVEPYHTLRIEWPTPTSYAKWLAAHDKGEVVGGIQVKLLLSKATITELFYTRPSAPQPGPGRPARTGKRKDAKRKRQYAR